MVTENGPDPLTMIEFIISHPMAIEFIHHCWMAIDFSCLNLMAIERVLIAIVTQQPKPFRSPPKPPPFFSIFQSPPPFSPFFWPYFPSFSSCPFPPSFCGVKRNLTQLFNTYFSWGLKEKSPQLQLLKSKANEKLQKQKVF